MRRTSTTARTARAALAGIMLAGAAAAATAAPAQAAGCEESVYRDYTLSAQGWAKVAGYQSFNPGTAGSYTIEMTKSVSSSSTVQASIGASVGTVLAEVNSEVAADFTRTASVSHTESVTVNVRERPYVQVVRVGTYMAKYWVTATRITPTCKRAPAGSGYAYLYRRAVGTERA